MADFDWKSTLKGIAPVLGGLLTAAGGPAGALAGAALTAAANALGVPDSPNAVQIAIEAGLTPEQKTALATADLQYKQAILEAGIKEKEIAADTEKAYLADINSARIAHAQTQGVLWLGYGINTASYITIFAVLWGCYRLLSNGFVEGVDPGMAAIVGSVVGAVVQWLMSNAAQANGFFFGGSPGGRKVSEDLAKAVSGVVAAMPKKPE